jgi:mycothiol synthase
LPLVAWGEDQARALAIASIRVSLFGAPGLGPLLAARGYALTERFLRLVLEGEPSSPGPLPPGVRIVSLASVGLERFLAMSNAAFATVPGALPLSVEDWNDMARSPGYRSDLLCILADDTGPIGFARCEIEGTVGSVDALALDPRVRGLGLGRWLLRWSGRAMLGAGCAEVDIWVAESNTPALRLYESEGYRLEKARESWELALTQ